MILEEDARKDAQHDGDPTEVGDRVAVNLSSLGRIHEGRRKREPTQPWCRDERHRGGGQERESPGRQMPYDCCTGRSAPAAKIVSRKMSSRVRFGSQPVSARIFDVSGTR